MLTNGWHVTPSSRGAREPPWACHHPRARSRAWQSPDAVTGGDMRIGDDLGQAGHPSCRNAGGREPAQPGLGRLASEFARDGLGNLAAPLAAAVVGLQAWLIGEPSPAVAV